MAQRLWKEAQRPEWTKAQAERLDEGHFRRCAAMKSGSSRRRSDRVAGRRSGSNLGLGIGPLIAGPGAVEVLIGEDEVGGHRSLPPWTPKKWLQAVGKRIRIPPPLPRNVCMRTWALTA